MERIKHYFLYFSVFIMGGAVLVIEILGTRILAPFYGQTIFVWSALISVTLGSLALGYWIGGRTADKHPDSRLFFGSIFIAGALVVIVSKISQFVILWSDGFGLRVGPVIASIFLFFPVLFF